VFHKKIYQPRPTGSKKRKNPGQIQNSEEIKRRWFKNQALLK
jgi:hypothetical protein